jgi:hypothetical protein
LEQRQWWPWAIKLFDLAAQESPTDANFHSRRTSYFRAANLRMDHRIEYEKGKTAMSHIAQSGESDPLVTEAIEKLRS